MAEAYDWGVREQAEEYYVLDGHTYKEVSGLTGVSVSQLKRWSADAGWTESRREHRRALGDIKRKTVLLRRDLLEKAVNSLDPQRVYAFAAIEKATRGKEKEKVETNSVVPVEHQEFESTEEMIQALQDAVAYRVNAMISSPKAMILKDLKELKSAADMLEDWRRLYAMPDPESTRPKDLPEDAKRTIREMYGLKS